MAKTHHKHENVQFAVESAKPMIDDYEEEVLKVRKFYIVPEGDQVERISYNTDIETEEERKVNGLPTSGTKERMATLEELPEELKQLAKLADKYEDLQIEASFIEWDQSVDEETNGDNSVFFMQESHLEDLKIVDERVKAESGEDDSVKDDTEDFVIKPK